MDEASSRGFIADILVIAGLMASVWLLTEGEEERGRGEQLEAAEDVGPPDLRPGKGESQG
ncbi:MAG TPA: hypothetical protein PKM09_04350 [Bacillota bacterium]|jgi:hypothetical protein|nr:hypothetical protein [Bacillota bacterium]HNY67930.1 hypothetical protein [Bacillota bacterium]HOI38360.1 hypothetical protein [Bacillota bacterium]HPU75532.1 hypothetical protein [Bacillota bacterium]